MIDLSKATITVRPRSRGEPLVFLSDRIDLSDAREVTIKLESAHVKRLAGGGGASTRGEIAAILIWAWKRLSANNAMLVASGSHLELLPHDGRSPIRLTGRVELADPHTMLVPLPREILSSIRSGAVTSMAQAYSALAMYGLECLRNNDLALVVERVNDEA